MAFSNLVHSPYSTLSRLCDLAKVVLFIVVGIVAYGGFSTEYDAHTAFYFICISITTVGYGDFSPALGESGPRLFTMIYVTYGFITIFGIMGEATDKFFEHVAEKIKEKQRAALGDDVTVPPDDSDIDAALRQKRIFFLVAILFLQLGGAVAVYVSEKETFNFVDSLYWAWQTTSTVGYGDSFLHKRTRIFGAFYALLSVGALAACLGGLTGASEEAKDEKKYRKLMRRELDLGLIDRLDRDNNGVDRAEFLVGMLVAMDCASERECAGILARFAKLDADGSGQLTRDDMLKHLGEAGVHGKEEEDNSYIDDL